MLEVLASEPPEFRLPPATVSHTRSYLNANSLDPTDKALVFDAFLAFGEQRSCWITWPTAEMNRIQREVLERLLGGLNFFGRSEAWVSAALSPDEPPESAFMCSAAGGAFEPDFSSLAAKAAAVSGGHNSRSVFPSGRPTSSENRRRQESFPHM